MSDTVGPDTSLVSCRAVGRDRFQRSALRAGAVPRAVTMASLCVSPAPKGAVSLEVPRKAAARRGPIV